jgi:carboxymethylenebutenolidase
MCFDADSHPPVLPMAGGSIDSEDVVLKAADGNRFAAFHARAASPTGAAMLILPDVRGLSRFYEELALRFAETGVDALAIDYFGRTAGLADRGDDFQHMPHVEGLTWGGVAADAATGVERLRSSGGDVRALFSIGFCMGGRFSFVLGTRDELELSGVVGFYGPTVGPGRAGAPAPVDVADRITCPLLGLFGGADQGIPEWAVEKFRSRLTEAGVDHALHTYPGAPHSFFDRKQEQFGLESADAWQRVLDFVRDHTPKAMPT